MTTPQLQFDPDGLLPPAQVPMFAQPRPTLAANPFTQYVQQAQAQAQAQAQPAAAPSRAVFHVEPSDLPPAARSANPFRVPAEPAAEPPAAPAAAPSLASPEITADQAEVDRLRRTGSGVSQIKNKWLRGLARVGDIAGTIIDPAAMIAVPGSTLHHGVLVNNAANRLTADTGQAEEVQKAGQATQAAADASAERQAQTALAKEQENLLENPPPKQYPRQIVTDANGGMYTFDPAAPTAAVPLTGPDGKQLTAPPKNTTRIEATKELGLATVTTDEKGHSTVVPLLGPGGQSLTQAGPKALPTKNLQIGGKTMVAQLNPDTGKYDTIIGEAPPTFAESPYLETQVVWNPATNELTPGMMNRRAAKGTPAFTDAAGNEIPGGAPVSAQAGAELEKELATARAADTRLNVMAQNADDIAKAAKHGASDQQAMVSLLSQHIGMTLGMQTTMRASQGMFNEAAASAPWIANLKAKWDKNGLLEGVTLTPGQIADMVTLAKQRRDFQWQQVQAAFAQNGIEYKLGPRAEATGPAPVNGAPGAANAHAGLTQVTDGTRSEWIPDAQVAQAKRQGLKVVAEKAGGGNR